MCSLLKYHSMWQIYVVPVEIPLSVVDICVLCWNTPRCGRYSHAASIVQFRITVQYCKSTNPLCFCLVETMLRDHLPRSSFDHVCTLQWTLALAPPSRWLTPANFWLSISFFCFGASMQHTMGYLRTGRLVSLKNFIQLNLSEYLFKISLLSKAIT